MPQIFNTSLKTICRLFVCLAISQLYTDLAIAKKPSFKGPIIASVDRVIDGDTILVKARIWLNQELVVLVRLSGIDAPELKSRNPNHRKIAIRASKILQQITYGRQIRLHNIRHGKYAGRVIADVYLDDGTNLSNHLLKEGVAVPYGQKFKIMHPETGHPCITTSCRKIMYPAALPK